ncbi:uncharacterized protein LOC133920542 [Phragmites australis]|uniref:uncharacterized protein LOC133920542 n=1 Tax=Phragmites australis TaxID=29695 RepID=UPI002D767E7E|nr:uncharacterized protein LOC133920542 [Phragmites australis]
MKKASRFLKQLFSTVVATVKAGSTAVGTKAGSLTTRLIVLRIMRNKKLLVSAIQSKIHATMGGGGGGGSQGGHGNAVASHHGGINEGAGLDAGGHGDNNVHPLTGGSRKAAMLQSLPSFVVEQETRAVVLLSSLPSFALERDGGEEEVEDSDVEREKQVVANAAPPGSAIELARGAAEGCGRVFRLEDEIDRVADVFIRRFHDQMKLQKLESFKRFCEMVERGT